MTNISLTKLSREPPHNIKATNVLVLFPRNQCKIISETKSRRSLGEAVALFIVVQTSVLWESSMMW